MKRIFTLTCFCLLFTLNAYSVEQNDQVKVDKDNTKLTLEISANDINDVGVKTENIKIDDNTTAKITISTQEQNKTNETQKQEINKRDTKPKDDVLQDNKNDKNENIGILEKSKQFIANGFSNNNSNETQNINIQGEYDINKTNVIRLQDGVKNININFQPNINVGCDKNCAVKNKNNSAQSRDTLKASQKNNKSVSIGIKNKKTKVGKKKSLKKTEKKADNKTNKTNDKNIHTEAEPVYTKSSDKKHQTLRKIYENSELSCVGEECNDISVKPKDAIYSDKQQGIQQPNQVIIKEQQPVYVINRIITMDDDMNLSDTAIQKLAQEQNGSIMVVNDGNGSGDFSASADGMDKFKQRYDVIATNDISYGEVAFVDDYND